MYTNFDPSAFRRKEIIFSLSVSVVHHYWKSEVSIFERKKTSQSLRTTMNMNNEMFLVKQHFLRFPTINCYDVRNVMQNFGWAYSPASKSVPVETLIGGNGAGSSAGLKVWLLRSVEFNNFFSIVSSETWFGDTEHFRQFFHPIVIFLSEKLFIETFNGRTEQVSLRKWY